MSAAAALLTAIACLAVLVAALAAAIASRRALRRRRAARDRRLAEPLRPLLLLLVAGEEEESAAAAARLSSLDPAAWRVVEPAVVALLGKVRGDAQRDVVRLLEDRGVLAGARRGLASASAVRRAGAAHLLGAAGDDRAARRLVQRLCDRDPEVRQVAARTLGRTGSPEVAVPLLAALAEGRVPAAVVAQALLRIGLPAAAALARATSSPVPAVRTTAVEVLGRVGAVSAFPQLQLRLFRDPLPEVRARAATALGRLGAPAALHALMEAASPAEPLAVRLAATRALGELGDPAAGQRLRLLLHEPDARVASTAGTALLALGDEGRAVLLDVAAGRASARAGARAREALAVAQLSDPAPVPDAAPAPDAAPDPVPDPVLDPAPDLVLAPALVGAS
ncbi:HEAT repeat domain-containing protein [Quadrisphaera sp. DSM 44207]|uniref:HEAT repeat domain-containing protein n=1 Tax=Quadrisphaera sp. DSM 44207 TaxID=1881057 RepID=UPI0008823F99|nr:HEAT repeat domain-containing protein [Quadrisphaera sp. DSM 44207]SDQ68840.1 HEAT repeat [Quadrisphaera sp. DSM 44207]